MKSKLVVILSVVEGMCRLRSALSFPPACWSVLVAQSSDLAGVLEVGLPDCVDPGTTAVARWPGLSIFCPVIIRKTPVRLGSWHQPKIDSKEQPNTPEPFLQECSRQVLWRDHLAAAAVTTGPCAANFTQQPTSAFSRRQLLLLVRAARVGHTCGLLFRLPARI